MRPIRWFVVVLAVLWVAGELAVVPFAEREIERRVAARSRERVLISCTVSDVPEPLLEASRT